MAACSLRGWRAAAALSARAARVATAGAAAAIVGSYAAFDWLVSLLAPIQTQFVLSTLLMSLFLMGPVALLSGLLFTALGDQLRARSGDAGVATGLLTLANTLGAMLGSLLAAFVLLPLLGLERSLFVLASLYAAAALEGGLATYWLPAHLLLENEALAIVRAFCDAFEDCSLWSGLNLDWILMGSRGGIAPVSRERFSRLWTLPGPGTELRRLGIDRPEQLVGQFMADAAALRELTARTLPLADNFPRRIAAALYSERNTPRYVSLMDAGRARDRMANSPWASAILPAALVADSKEAFRRRTILQTAFYPQLRPADYAFWRDMADLIRHTDLVELPRWLLGSGARVARIAGEPAQARALMGWIAANLREQEPYRSFLAWADTDCVARRR